MDCYHLFFKSLGRPILKASEHPFKMICTTAYRENGGSADEEKVPSCRLAQAADGLDVSCCSYFALAREKPMTGLSVCFSCLLLLAAAEECVEETPQFLQRGLELGRLSAAGLPEVSLTAEQARAKDQLSEFFLFVKFHKVGSSTMRHVILSVTQSDIMCTQQCGNPYWPCMQKAIDGAECLAKFFSGGNPGCSLVPSGCTSHAGLGVIEDAYKSQISVANSSDLTSLKNLWPDSKRYALLSASAKASYFLPSTWGPQKRIVITTILREPAEKLRSYFYYVNPEPTHQRFAQFLGFQRDYVAGNWTSEEFELQKSWPRGASTLSIVHRSCCEFHQWLGQGDVAKSQRVLATQFDLVGLNERMDETVVCLGRLYGKTPEEMGLLRRTAVDDKVNDVKLDWLPREREMAAYITAKDKEVYNFGAKLFDLQSISLWNNAETLKKVTAAMRAVQDA